tara:strand:+ start:1651 stop:1827 length:177 start_codon:yes stop_codon:yes gene_type:complete
MTRRRWPTLPGLDGEIANLTKRVEELERKDVPPTKKKSPTPTRIERKIAKAKEKEARN